MRLVNKEGQFVTADGQLVNEEGRLVDEEGNMIDKDGTPGIFTKRIVNNKKQVLVGSTDCYKAVSRKNYLH